MSWNGLKRAEVDSYRAKKDLNGLKYGLNGPEWTQTGRNGFIQGQNGLLRTKIDSNRAKMALNGLKGTPKWPE